MIKLFAWGTHLGRGREGLAVIILQHSFKEIKGLLRSKGVLGLLKNRDNLVIKEHGQ